jgi:predicted RNase H-like HicB family nuclease
MNENTRYVKIVEWSEKDQLFIGSCPGLFYGGCHGENEKEVFSELCDIVEETIKLYKQDGKSLPPTTSGKDYANKMVNII